ncbi:hypothetical protein KY358_05880 [Candidatus Woesearchaeota archaeon]|nr:hypothetical protein [Candidatus Woesearchaeota archaeon]
MLLKRFPIRLTYSRMVFIYIILGVLGLSVLFFMRPLITMMYGALRKKKKELLASKQKKAKERAEKKARKKRGMRLREKKKKAEEKRAVRELNAKKRNKKLEKEKRIAEKLRKKEKKARLKEKKKRERLRLRREKRERKERKKREKRLEKERKKIERRGKGIFSGLSRKKKAKKEEPHEEEKKPKKKSIPLVKELSKSWKIEVGRYETDIDVLYKIIDKKGRISLSAVADYFGVTKAKAEEWASILQEHDLADIHYPPIGDPELVRKGEQK